MYEQVAQIELRTMKHEIDEAGYWATIDGALDIIQGAPGSCAADALTKLLAAV